VPFLLIELLVLSCILLMPWLATGLPNLMG
jgi:hypothetical protein